MSALPKYSFTIGGNLFLGGTEEDLTRMVVSHYATNGIEVVEDEIRAFVKKSKTIYIPGIVEHNPGKEKKKLTFDRVLSGANAVIKDIAGLTVSQVEVNRRGSICSSCPLVSETKGCMGCGFAKTLAKWGNKLKSLINRPNMVIPEGLENKYCDFCKCSLYVMLPSEINNFKETNSTQRPNHCWINPESTNFVG